MQGWWMVKATTRFEWNSIISKRKSKSLKRMILMLIFLTVYRHSISHSTSRRSALSRQAPMRCSYMRMTCGLDEQPSPWYKEGQDEQRRNHSDWDRYAGIAGIFHQRKQ